MSTLIFFEGLNHDTPSAEPAMLRRFFVANLTQEWCSPLACSTFAINQVFENVSE